jgi:hypothetical protein
MRVFSCMEIHEAEAYAAQGGQAVHLHQIIGDPARAPQCFVRALARGEYLAHLFDQDEKRLISTARKLGVRVVVVEHRGQPGQHVDLMGRPLQRALALCKADRSSL